MHKKIIKFAFELFLHDVIRVLGKRKNQVVCFLNLSIFFCESLKIRNYGVNKVKLVSLLKIEKVNFWKNFFEKIFKTTYELSKNIFLHLTSQ